MEDQKDINTIKLQAIKQTHFMMGMNHEQNHSRGRSSTDRIDSQLLYTVWRPIVIVSTVNETWHRGVDVNTCMQSLSVSGPYNWEPCPLDSSPCCDCTIDHLVKKP